MLSVKCTFGQSVHCMLVLLNYMALCGQHFLQCNVNYIGLLVTENLESLALLRLLRHSWPAYSPDLWPSNNIACITEQRI